jgi:hypothetical protein
MPQENLALNDEVLAAFVKIVAHVLVINNETSKKFTNPDAMADYVIAHIQKEKQS